MSNFPILDMTGPVADESYGFHFPQKLDRFMNRGGATAIEIGDVMMLDVLDSDSSATTADNTATGLFVQCIQPVARFIVGRDPGICIVVTDFDGNAGADNASFIGCWFGAVDAYVIGASGELAVGTPLVATTAEDFDVVTLTNERIFAYGREVSSGITTHALHSVFLENGFMWQHGITAVTVT